MNENRQKAIETLKEMQTEIDALEKELSNLGVIKNGQIDLVQEPRERLRKLKVNKLCAESQIVAMLPVELMGFVGEDEDEVDQDEHGRVMEIYHYLGCPVFPTDRPRHYGTVAYSKFQDITEILKLNTGKFLKITIEAIPMGETEECAKCDKRFQCLTTKVRG